MQLSSAAASAGLSGLERVLDDRAGGKLHRFFPTNGPYRRALYPKHVAFFAAGAKHRERGAISANRVGKSLMACFETTLHLTGEYPAWWKGRRFSAPVRWWCCGDTSGTVRDIIQEQLMGPRGAIGSGFLPRHLIHHHVSKRGIADAMDTVWVRHRTGGLSVLQFKGYEARREAFQGTSQHGIVLDEEPPYDIYGECLLRTAKTGDFPGGLLLLTFTPLKGLTDLVREFFPSQLKQTHTKAFRYVTRITWDDVPHLDEEEKADLMRRMPPYQRDARTRGIPQLGSGAIYPFPVRELKIPDISPLPDHWVRGFALDAQPLWKSSVHCAFNREAQTWYVYSNFKREQATPADHSAYLRKLGTWIPGVGDAAAMVRDAEREQYIDVYREFGIDLVLAEKSVEAGIQDVYMLLAEGRLKVFASCLEFFDEFETYQRDEKGRVIKRNDHLMDCLRYLVRGHLARGDNWMVTKPPVPDEFEGVGSDEPWQEGQSEHRWMA